MKKINEFYFLTNDLLNNKLILNMQNLEHHCDNSSLLEHLMHTSYTALLLADFFKANKKEVARAALLHDFRVSNDIKIRGWFVHSKFSANAALTHFDISSNEYFSIQSHMWPLNISLTPKTKEAFIVNISDTYCAIIEMLGLYKKSKIRKEILNIINNIKVDLAA